MNVSRIPQPSGSESVKRIFIDCTSTLHADLNTGIQRVVRNIVNSSAKIGSSMNLHCQPVAFNPLRGFYKVDHLPGPVSATLAISNDGRSFASRVRRVAKRVLSHAGIWNAAKSARQWALTALSRTLRPLRQTANRDMQPGKGDILLLPDLSWNENYWDDVRAAKRNGAQIGIVVYDLIPLKYPEACGETVARIYREWWDMVRELADIFVCISDSVWQDVQAFERQSSRGKINQRQLAGGSFQLGCELDGSSRNLTIRPALAEIFSDQPARSVHMMVGTISPRKNHALALDAFDRLWSEGSQACLLIAGKYGWDADEMIHRIQSHPQYNRKLFWFDDLQDGELDYCYRHSGALVTTSYAEGFNLPIVEALSKGCPVLASDLAVHREVGGGYAAFFPSGNATALSDLIASYQRTGTLPDTRSLADFHWPDWNESCRELLQQLVFLSTGPRSEQADSRVTRSAA